MGITYHDIRSREYNMLVRRLRAKNLFIEHDLFIAVFHVITNIEAGYMTKREAIRFSANAIDVGQQDIKNILDDIRYLTPTRTKQKYSLRGIYESRILNDVLARQSI